MQMCGRCHVRAREEPPWPTPRNRPEQTGPLARPVVATAIGSEVHVQSEAPDLLLPALLGRDGGHDPGLLVLAHALLEEVRLPLQRDELHPVEGVRRSKELGVAQRRQQAVGHELNVPRHELAVHADEVAGERLADEAALDLHGGPHDVVHHVLRELVLQHAVDHAGKLRVQALVPRDQLVGEGQARHEAALLQPVDGAEGAAEEDALHGCEGHHALGEAVLPIHPLHCPVCLLLDGRHRLDGLENLVLLRRIADVLLDEQRICLGVDVLHRHLEAVEGPGLGDLDLAGELRREVLEHDAVRGGEEGEDVLDEVPLARREALPVLDVLGEVHLLRRPEGRLVLLVHLPDPRILDGEHHPPLRVLLQQRVRPLQLPVLRGDTAEGRAGRSGGGARGAQQVVEVRGQLEVVVLHHNALGRDEGLVREAVHSVAGRQVLVLVHRSQRAVPDAVGSCELPRGVDAPIHADEEAEAASCEVLSDLLHVLGGCGARLAPGGKEVQDDGHAGALRELVQRRVCRGAGVLVNLELEVRRNARDKVGQSAHLDH
mmetsp:Transcript_43084/g.134054  ORF Transcript_43084/g.134054 Transcript_43084/m.134054 type:complete len:545 (-) Transcript_43084:27-1661(-)